MKHPGHPFPPVAVRGMLPQGWGAQWVYAKGMGIVHDVSWPSIRDNEDEEGLCEVCCRGMWEATGAGCVCARVTGTLCLN